MEQTLQFDFIFKFILVGDTSVGKSTLLSMFVQKRFNNDSNPTMGVQFATKKIHVAGKLIKLQVWDTAGQQSFRTITKAYYKNAIGVILVYDLTSPKTIQSLQSWLTQIQDNSNQKAQIIILGNKSDLIKQNNNKLPSQKLGQTHFITSAKTGQNVDKAFMYLAQKIVNRIRNGQINPDGRHGVKKGIGSRTNIKLDYNKQDDKQNQDKSNSCC